MARPIRQLPPLNTNYTPARPWQCATHAAHECFGDVVGAIGAYPVCANGAVAESAAQDADEARIAALLADPEFRAACRRDADIERRIEAGF